MSETGHINGGQQFGGGFDQQDHGQYPSGPRSISLQVCTPPDNICCKNLKMLEDHQRKLTKRDFCDINDILVTVRCDQDLASSSRANPPPSRRPSRGLLDVTNVNINNSEIDKVTVKFHDQSEQGEFCRTRPSSSSQQLVKHSMPPGTLLLPALTARWNIGAIS